MHLDAKVQKYLRRSYGKDAELLGIERLGEGVHGAAYLLKFRTPHEEQRLIIKALSRNCSDYFCNITSKRQRMKASLRSHGPFLPSECW